ncbi:MAG: hypothetical protein P4L53_20415 [Candidatus Obscuribacterales bacterium]|nr:hypothetical protein [Candidatus Obscuribacterales bacterium]
MKSMLLEIRSTFFGLACLAAMCTCIGASGVQAAEGNATGTPALSKPAETTDGTSSTKQPSQPLEGHLTRHSLGIRSLPADGREPDAILGHFAVGLPFMTKSVSKPPSPFVTMVPKMVKKWQGKQVFPCVIKLTKLKDGSDGYFFKTFNDDEGPCGWMMPQPKVPGKDKVVPWAIYFDQ